MHLRVHSSVLCVIMTKCLWDYSYHSTTKILLPLIALDFPNVKPNVHGEYLHFVTAYLLLFSVWSNHNRHIYIPTDHALSRHSRMSKRRKVPKPWKAWQVVQGWHENCLRSVFILSCSKRFKSRRTLWNQGSLRFIHPTYLPAPCPVLTLIKLLSRSYVHMLYFN